MEGQEPDEGGRDVLVMYRSYCCENHVAPGIGLIEPEKSFFNITARTPTLRSAGGGSPSARGCRPGDPHRHPWSAPKLWGRRISLDRGAPDECDPAVLLQKTGLGAEKDDWKTR